jgi:non-ribosomal peptide synthetase component F
MSDGERQLVVSTWNDTACDYPRHASIHDVFSAEVAARPDEVAVIQGERQVTRQWIDTQASVLARRLHTAGVTPGDVVGVSCARSPEMVVALLAILKAGAAYLPLSQRDPTDRQVFILRDAGARVLVTEPGLIRAVQEKAPEITALDVRDRSAGAGELSAAAPASSDALAYIMYTSGSTGTPKGVLVPHRAITRLVLRASYADLGPARTILQLSPLAFDASTFDLLGAAAPRRLLRAVRRRRSRRLTPSREPSGVTTSMSLAHRGVLQHDRRHATRRLAAFATCSSAARRSRRAHRSGSMRCRSSFDQRLRSDRRHDVHLLSRHRPAVQRRRAHPDRSAAWQHTRAHPR